MREWHQPPEYFLEHWTDEQFERFWDARNKNILDTNRAIKETMGSSSYTPADQPSPQPAKQVSDTEMFSTMGIGSA